MLYLRCLLPISLLFTAALTFGQAPNVVKARDLAREAIELMDNGQVDESIPLLKEAEKLDPDNYIYSYELAYAHYMKQDYRTAEKFLKRLLKHKDVTDQTYQMLGNAYDMQGKPAKAIQAYEQGLERFPSSGKLYLEMTVMQLGKQDYDRALAYAEKGIEVDPLYPSNYYWAAKLFLHSTEEVWGMIYGEVFMNLERGTARTAEISKLLYDTYLSGITITSDTSFTISFSQNATLHIDDLTAPDGPKLPYGMSVYEPTLMAALVNNGDTIDMEALDRLRSSFVDLYYEQGHHERYPNVLFAFQKRLQELGHLEAYNHWVLMKGDEAAFDAWHEENSEKWARFVDWFGENPMEVNEANKFQRGRYH